MPELKVKHVVTFSSEDKAFPAENLVDTSGFKKWKTGKSGEKNAVVVLQLEAASQIHQIDIGNESSAFVEVLVGRTGMSAEDYQVILVSSSFMSPLESRGNQNCNRVRIFHADSLSQAVRDEKWDIVKVVCSQPFNKGFQYGLSFIKLYSKPEDGTNSSTKIAPSSKTSLGAFVLKSEDSGDDISAGSLFKQKKEQKESVPLSGAAAVRAAARLADESRPSTSRDVTSASPSSRPPKERSHDSPGTSKTPTSRLSHDSPSSSKTPQNKRRHSPDPGISRSHEKSKVTPEAKPSLQKQSTSLSSVSSTSSHKVKDGAPPLKRSKTEPPKKSKEKEFGSLMKKVTFVLSGFQNPYRGDLRDKAMEMGATYKPDWGRGCTHLICAFENTPKYNQVKGKGRIVKKEWLNDCYKKKQLLPWRNYRLGRARSPPDASDESSEEESFSPVRKRSPQSTPHRKDSEKKKMTPQKTTTSAKSDSGDSTEPVSDMDTDEEIERMKKDQNEKAAQQSTTKSPAKSKDSPKGKTATPTTHKSPKHPTNQNEESDEVYNMSTDEEEIDDRLADKTSDKNGSGDKAAGDFVDDLMDMFTDKVFFLYGKFSASDRRTLTRYIAAYDGELEDYMTDQVTYVITDSGWDSNFDKALSDNPGLSFVRPAWIHACHENQKLVPHQKFVIAPE